MSATRLLSALPMRPASKRPSVTGRALLIVTLFLVGFGLISVYSASSYVAQAQGLEDSHYLFLQMSRAGIGLVALAVASVVNYRLYQSVAWPLLGLTVALLVLLILPGTESIAPGSTARGAGWTSASPFSRRNSRRSRSFCGRRPSP